MKRLAILPVLALALAGCQDTPMAVEDEQSLAFAAVATTTVEDIPLVINAFIPCTGDVVLLEGTLHTVFHTTFNDNNFVSKYHFSPQQLTGVSAMTGAQYQGTGVTQGTTTGSFVNGQYSDTYVNNFRMIGQGPGNNYLVHSTIHVTFNANGDITADHENTSIECM